MGPDENASDDILEEDMYQGWDDDDVTLAHLKDVLIDCAVDETLARSVFDIITGDADESTASTNTVISHSNLRSLRLHVRRRQDDFRMPGQGQSYFDGLMELFTCEWLIERRNEPHRINRRNRSHDDAPHAAHGGKC